MILNRYSRLFKKVSRKYVVNLAWIVGGGLACISVYKTRRQMHDAIPNDRCANRQNYEHVYAVDPEEYWSPIKKHMIRWWPVRYIARPFAWQLLQDIRRSFMEINDDAIKKFAAISNLLESECNHFAMCLDLKTAIALARAGADPRLFTVPRMISKDNKNYYGDRFRQVFSTLSNDNIHEALDDLVKAALKYYDPTEVEAEDRTFEYNTGFETDYQISQKPNKGISQYDFLKICLQGVVSHSRVYESIDELLNLEILDLLMIISKEYPEDVEIMSLVLKVLANLSFNASSAQKIKDAGCLQILAAAGQSTNLKILLPAKRALHNLDRRTNAPMLPPGMYQLHPEHGCDECFFQYDIVFIHGLLGGVFRTWRRQDVDPFTPKTVDKRLTDRETLLKIWKSRMLDLRSKAPMLYNPAVLTNSDEAVQYPVRQMDSNGNYFVSYEDIGLELEEVMSFPTLCWPRDWLPTDCPNSRIIAVDFESFVSRWMNVCPIETAERKLPDRSAELLKKLSAAGIGQRPIIWVTHSMGGLILKSLLCQAEANPDTRKISENTKGIVFCSVPHYGTHLAVLNTARRWLLLPTEEISDLSNESNQLSTLHNSFLALYAKYKFKLLSFAEILETRTGLGMKFKLVPYSSSDIGLGEFFPLRLDHQSTCKPWSRRSFLYVKIVEFIKDITRNVVPPDSLNPSNSSNTIEGDVAKNETENEGQAALKTETEAATADSKDEKCNTTISDSNSTTTNSNSSPDESSTNKTNRDKNVSNNISSPDDTNKEIKQ